MVGIFLVGDVLAPVWFRLLVAGNGLGNGQMRHEVVGCGAMPMPLIGRRVDNVACADLDDLTTPGLDEALSLGDIEGLADRVGVPSRPRWA